MLAPNSGYATTNCSWGPPGRRVPEKGLAEFAEAAARLRDRATFVWVGPEDDTEPSGRTGRPAAVRFVDERTDMPAVYSALDVFVLACTWIGLLGPSMEAAACGVPMVLTDIRGCREIGRDGEHLFLAPVNDGRALGDAVERLLADPGLRGRLGSTARVRASMFFDQRRCSTVTGNLRDQVARRAEASRGSASVA